MGFVYMIIKLANLHLWGDIQYFDKQLQLEAMIAFHDGFNKIRKQSIEHLEYISLGPELKKTAFRYR